MVLKYLSVILSNKSYKHLLLGIVCVFFLNYSSIAMDLASTENYGYPGPPVCPTASFKCGNSIGTKSQFVFEEAIEANERAESSSKFYFLSAMFSQASSAESAFMDYEPSHRVQLSVENSLPHREEPLNQPQAQIHLPNRPMSDSLSQKIQTIKRLIHLGLSHAEVATIVECPLGSVQRHAQGERSEPTQPFSAANFKYICRLKNTGVSFEVISTRTGVPVSRVKYYLMSLKESDNIGNINNMSNLTIGNLKNKILERVRQMPLEEKLAWFN